MDRSCQVVCGLRCATAAQILRSFRDEIPHAIGVQTEELDYVRKKDLYRIRAIVYTEHDSQKGMIIGKGGMGDKTAQACRDLTAVHAVFPGGCAVLANGGTIYLVTEGGAEWRYSVDRAAF